MMVRVSQSATGQYVVSHDPSDTVMVGDDLVELYERMKAHLEASPGGLEHSPAPGPNAARGTGWARWALVLVACVLPFVWLGVLHLSLGQLVSELTMVTPDHDSPDDQDLRARVERLERQVDAASRSRAAKPPRKPAAPRPSPAPAVEVEAEAKAKAEAEAEPADND